MGNTQIIICLIIFIVSLISYILNKIPMWVTSIGALALLVITGCLDATTSLSGFSNTNTILMGSMFIVATGLRKTSFVSVLCDSIMRITRGSFRKAYFGYLFIAVLLAQLIPSPMVVFALVAPLLAELCDKMGVSVSKVMFPLVVTAVATTGIAPLASAVSDAAMYNGYMETYGMTQYSFTAMDFTIARWPILIIVPLWALFLAPRFMPDQPSVPIAGSNGGKKGEEKKLSRFSDLAGTVIFFATIFCLVFADFVGQPTWLIALIGGLLMVLCGTLDGREAINSLPLDSILLFVGALGMGSALSATGAGEIIGNAIAAMLGGTHNSYLIGGVFFVIPFLITQVMLNRAVSAVFMPLCIMTCQALGADPTGPMILVTAGCLTAFLTPMATPAVPMAMASGGYDLKDLLKGGWLITIILAVVYVLYTMTVMPCF